MKSLLVLHTQSQYLIRQVGGAPGRKMRGMLLVWSQYLIRQVGGAPLAPVPGGRGQEVSIPYSSGRGGARSRPWVQPTESGLSIPYSSGRGGALISMKITEESHKSQYLIRQVGGAPRGTSLWLPSWKVSIPYSSGRGGAPLSLNEVKDMSVSQYLIRQVGGAPWLGPHGELVWGLNTLFVR